MTKTYQQFAVSTLSLAVQGALLAMLAAAAPARAADDEADVAALTKPTNTVEVGAEGVSKSSAKFGEYNGLDKSGGYFIGNFNVRGGDAYQSYDGGTGVTRWELKGTDLGTDSRELGATLSNQGQWSIGVGFNQLRRHLTDTYQTPLQGSMGGNNFSLPGSFGTIDVFNGGSQALTADQQAAFQTRKIYTERKNTSFNAGYIFSPQWSFQFDYNRLEQSGAKLIGISTDAQGVGIGGENSLTLMNPTNYKTDTYELALSWAGDKGQLTGSYFASIFRDGYDSVSWTNPFCNSDPGVGGICGAYPPYPVNVFATPPNNNFHQLNLTGGYDFSESTRLAGGLSYGRNTQNANFINDPLFASVMPRNSLDGLVITTHADLKLTNQTTKDLQLSAGFKFNERDNRTPSSVYGLFNSVAGDPWGAVVNTPVSNKKYQLELGGSYRIDKNQNVRLAYEYEDYKRWCNNALANTPPAVDPAVIAAGLADVATTYPTYYTNAACVQSPESKEHKLSANYKLKLSRDLSLTAGYSFAKRHADINSSYYNPMQASAEGVQNFGYVGYFDASRKEQILKAGINWHATDRLNVGLNGRYLDDKYDDSTLGVKKGYTEGLNLDAAYSYAPEGTVSAYLSVQRRQRDLDSSADKSPLAPVAPDTLWSNRLTDDTDTIGITAKQKGLIGGRAELAGDLSYSLGKTRYSTQAGACTNALCYSATVDPAIISGDLPTIRSEMWRLKLSGIYQVDKSSKVGLTYLHQKLKSDDYYYSAYQLGSTDVTVLPTNQAAPSYTVNLLMASYIYSFR